MKTEAILFDNDGVLVDTEQLYFKANVEMFAEVSFELTAEMYEEFYLLQNIGAWHLLEQRGDDPNQFPAMREERNARYRQLLRNEEILIPGAIETVIDLSKRFIIGVVTSSRRDHFDIIHQRTGLSSVFDFVVAEGDYNHSKPSPEPYLAGIKRAGVVPDKCLAIEDTVRGLTAAKAAGLKCWVVPSPLTLKQDFSAADLHLQRIDEVRLRLEHGLPC